MDKIRLLYIAGCGRSGSTLLERVLGEIRGVFPVGELCHIWERGFLENQLCGCGNSFNSCNFWTQVTKKVFGQATELDICNVLSLRRRVQRMRYIPYLLFPKLRSDKFNAILDEYLDILGALYNGIADISSSTIIVDSSKIPLYAFVLANLKNVELYVIHLVRHSCAVAYSWKKKKVRPEITDRVVYMPRYSLFKTVREWNKINSLFLMAKDKFYRYYFLRYEDFVRHPSEMLKDIFSSFNLKIDEDFVSKIFQNNRICLHKNHTVSGNPIRFLTGEIEIFYDDSWQKLMSFKEKLFVRILTFPLLLKFGYW